MRENREREVFKSTSKRFERAFGPEKYHIKTLLIEVPYKRLVWSLFVLKPFSHFFFWLTDLKIASLVFAKKI